MFKFAKRYVMVAIACLMLLGTSGQMAKGQAEEQEHPFITLQDEVQKIADKASEEGDVSIFIGTSDGDIKMNETEVYSAASTIKVPILVEAIRQAEQENLELDEKISIDSSDIVGGGGILRLLSDNQSVTLRDLLTLMIIVSDNSATNMVIDRVGMDAVNETCMDMGCEQTKLQRYMMDLDSPVDNLTSAEDMVKILRAIDTGGIVSQEGRNEILRIMRAQKLTNGLPSHASGVDFASKGGSLSGPPSIRHDVALITHGNSTVYAAVLTRGLSKATARQAMAEIGVSIADYLTAPPPPSEPAQYETDFTEYEVGEAPSDWSTLWKESNWTVLDDPRRLEHRSVGDQLQRRALTWDEVGEVSGDVEMSAVVRARDTGQSKFQLGFHMSGNKDTSSSRNAYYLDVFESGGAYQVRINRFLNGRFTVLGREELPFTFAEDTWYQVVVQREGDTIRAKVWPYGEDEPDEWQAAVDDPSIHHGLVGLIHLTDGVVNDWAYIGVGTGGDPAPRAPEDLFEPEDPEVDKTALQNRVDEINSENLNEADYTEESWETLQGTLAAAENVLNDPDATQADVDAALEALNEARNGLEEAETTPISAESMKTRVERFAEEGAFESDRAVRSLTMHLTAVSRYEESEQADKVVKHMEGFKQLLNHQQENELISEQAYNALIADAELLIEKWR